MAGLYTRRENGEPEVKMKLDNKRKSTIINRNSFQSALKNEKGIALVMVLILSGIALAIIAGLIYMITAGTQISGIQKMYRTSLEAGMGGKDAMYELIRTRGDMNIPICFEEWTPTCETDKLTKSTADWNAACDKTFNIIPGTTTTYDMRCSLGIGIQYTAYAKIVDTVKGNSGADEGLIKTGVVISNPGEVQVMSIPYMYTVEIEAERTNNPAERAKLSVLYQY